ncbi:hypothetical protein [Ruegeria arenilitoris]|nr:hypothetical protein [Ruegeria arenilitoris]
MLLGPFFFDYPGGTGLIKDPFLVVLLVIALVKPDDQIASG